MHPGTPIAKRLVEWGYKADLAGWSGTRFLSKLPPESVDSLYVVHSNNPELADGLVEILTQLRFASRIVVLEAKEASAASKQIPTKAVLEYVDALVVYRTVE